MSDAGVCLLCEGIGVERDCKKAVELYTEAATESPLAMNGLARCYHMGKYVKKDYAMSMKLFKQAADRGLPIGIANVGYCYFYGQGAPRDVKKAVEHFRRAAEMENAWAIRCVWLVSVIDGHMCVRVCALLQSTC